MEADDLDSLIADSLSGVQAALEGDRKAAPSDTQRSAGEAVKELQQGTRSDAQPPGEDFFKNLVQTFQDENFQKAMAEAMQGKDAEPKPTPLVEPKPASAEGYAAASASTAPAASSTPADTTEDFLQNFMKNFDQAASSDPNFEKQLTTFMSSMLSNDLLTEPMQQIADALEPYLKKTKGLKKEDRTRYEAQLRLYRQIVGVYKSSPDPLPDATRDQVQRMLQELQALGQPPDEVMAQIVPKDVGEGGGESFEDLMKNMGLDSNLAAAEQDLMKKLADDPEELTKMMKEMTGGMPEEACKQQ
ncbi:unnamed protein product [Effrenium voratum]|nr:unnamed protein product [Effrenium voratum]